MTEATLPWRRYVAIGDSSTEGLDDSDGRGGYRGWANRLAERLAARQPALLYANLGVRGKRTRQIRLEQLPRALELEPDLVTLFAGTNDVVRRRFDPVRVGDDLGAIQEALVSRGAVVVGFTLPDLSRVLPLGRLLRGRIEALNQAIRDTSAMTGARCVDFAALASAGDPRVWSEDRLHANSRGHELIAHGLAHALGVADDRWQEPFPPAPAPTLSDRVRAELRWVRRYFLPWVWRHARGRSSGDRRGPKQPDLRPVSPDPLPPR